MQFVGASKVRGKLAIVTEFIELGNLTVSQLSISGLVLERY